jgi:hypothetical protein
LEQPKAIQLKKEPVHMSVRLLAIALIGSVTIFMAAAVFADDEFSVNIAQQWLGKLDNGDYAAAWVETAKLFKFQLTLKDGKNCLRHRREPFGCFITRNLLAVLPKKSLPGFPLGDYVVVQFDTSFAKKKAVVETVTFILNVEGHWKVIGYHVK